MGCKRKWTRKSPLKWLAHSKTAGAKGLPKDTFRTQMDSSNGGSVNLFDEASGQPVNIICFDGGLPKGFIHDCIYDELERGMNDPLIGVFDLAAGTSYGGVAALVASQNPQSMAAISSAKLMLNQIRCTKTSRIARLFKRKGKQTDNRAAIFKNSFGENELLKTDSGLKAFAVAAIDKDFVQEGMPEADPYLLRTYETPEKHPDAPLADGTSSIKMWEAAEATTASSLLHSRTEVMVPQAKGDHARLELCDGGIVAKDPTELAVYEAMALFPDRPIGLVLSIGCGRATEKNLDSSRHSMRSAIHTRSADLRATIEVMGGDYVRLDPCVGHHTSRARMCRTAKKYMAESYDARRARRLLKKYAQSALGEERAPRVSMDGANQGLEGVGPGRSRSRQGFTDPCTSTIASNETPSEGRSSSPVPPPLLRDAGTKKKSSKLLYDCIAERSITVMDSFDADALIALAGTFTRADHYHAKLLERMAIRSIAIMESFDSEGLKSLAAFYVKMNHSHPLLFARIEIASMAIIDTFDAQSLVGMVSLLAGEDQDRLPDLLDEGLKAA